MGAILKSTTQIDKMRIAGGHVAEILQILREATRPGITTGELDSIAEKELARRGGVSCFKNYVIRPGVPPFPAVICTSVNDEIVHGIPGKRVLKEGDIVALDFGASFDGWVGDSGITVAVGQISPQAQHLLDVTQEALQRGVAQAKIGNRLQAIGRAVQHYVESQGCSVVRHYTGHGVGRKMHEEPLVPNYVDPEMDNPILRAGMVFAIEPMVNAGRADTRELNDHWTVVTRDHSLSAYFEHTVAVTEHGPRILTLPLAMGG
jgi:methionyl aminopeptidase